MPIYIVLQAPSGLWRHN